MAREFANNAFRETRYKVGSFVIEKGLRPVKLEKVEGASLQSAEELDAKSGSYLESANHYYSTLESSTETEVKLEALFGLSQQLINLGRLGQARKYLDQFGNILRNDLSEADSLHYFARKEEKLGWIADYEGNYKEEVELFTRANGLIRHLKETDPKSEKLYLTAIHFLGRAHFGLGEYDKALGYFEEHLQNKNLGRNEQGFGHAWLARCYMAKKDMGRADREIENTRESFLEYLDDFPERGIMAFYYSLVGYRQMLDGNFKFAREVFERGLGIRYEKERYAKNEAELLYGIAATYWAEKNLGGAFVYFVRGLATYPLSAIRPTI